MAIIKNGFEFHNIPLELWNSDDYCLACHELPQEQSTVEFSGSWPLKIKYQEETGGPWLTKTVIFLANILINLELNFRFMQKILLLNGLALV